MSVPKNRSSAPQSSAGFSRRTVLSASAAFAGAVGLASVSNFTGSTPAQAAPGALGFSTNLINHGPAATGVNVRAAAVTTLRRTIPIAYLLSATTPASLTVVNLDSGEVYDELTLNRNAVASPTALPDGTVYFPLRDPDPALIYRYCPTLKKLEVVLSDPVGEPVVRHSIPVGDYLYGSTFPNAKAFSYQLSTKQVRDYGRVVESPDGYADALAVADGHLYVGTGIGDGRAIRINLATGAKTELHLPPGYEAVTRFYQARVVGKLVAFVFAPAVDGSMVLFWDTDQQAWALDRKIPRPVGMNVPLTDPTPDGRIYYRSGEEVYEYDTTTGAERATGWQVGGINTLNLLTVGTRNRTRRLLVSTTTRGTVTRFDLETGATAEFVDRVTPGPLLINALNVGPDQAVYVPTFLSSGQIGRFDPATGKKEQLAVGKQIDAVHSFGQDLLLGGYQGAFLHRFDTTRPWDYGTNPALQFTLQGAQQDRIIRIDNDGTRLLLGSVARYGVSGGALTIVEGDGSYRVHRDLVARHSVTAVAWGSDSLAYAGTAIFGGLSSGDGEMPARLLAFDPVTQQIVNELRPFDDVAVMSSLVMGSDGNLWGLTNNSDLFSYDLAAGKIIERFNLGTGVGGGRWGNRCILVTRPGDRLLYGLAAKQPFVFDPDTLVWQFLEEPEYERLAVAPNTGNLHVCNSSEFFTIELTG